MHELDKEFASLTQDYRKSAKVEPSKWLYTADERVEEEMVRQLKYGRPKGTTTHFSSIDPHFTWRRREMNIWTGYNNQGKTALLNELSLCRAIAEDIIIPIFSPENMPEDEYFMELAETFVGKTADKDYANCMSEKEMREAVKFLRSRFLLIYPSKMQFTIENIELAVKYLKDKEGDRVQMIIVDPYIKIKHDMRGMPEHLYASQFMMERVAFCRETDVTYNLVMHQTTPSIVEKTGLYPMPSGYKIKGGGTFADSVDNILLTERPLLAKDRKSTFANFTSEKVKKQKLTGIPGTAFLNYNRKDSRYYEADPNWIKNDLGGVEGFDWREEQTQHSYSPLAKLKGDPIPDPPVRKKTAPTPIPYGPIKTNGTDYFESIGKDYDSGDAPF